MRLTSRERREPTGEEEVEERVVRVERDGVERREVFESVLREVERVEVAILFSVSALCGAVRVETSYTICFRLSSTFFTLRNSTTCLLYRYHWDYQTKKFHVGQDLP